MSQFDLAAPARLDYAVADDACLPHVGRMQFAALALAGEHPWFAAHSWQTSAASLRSVEEDAVVSTRTDHGSSALVEIRGAWAYVLLEHGRIHVLLAGASSEAIVFAEAVLRARLPVATAAGRRVPVQFWARASYGGAAYSRTLEVPAWAEIAGNYPTATRTALDTLVAEPPRGAGRLLLWHGPPGTGKTHVVRALGWEWHDWCGVEYVTDPEEFFGSAQYMLEVLVGEDDEDDERWRLLVLEDTGELLSADAKERTGQGLSRFLNVVDGIIGQGLRVLVLVTTNEQLRHLHPAVSRPGRCAAALAFDPFPPPEAAAWLAAHELEAVEAEATLAELFVAERGGPLPRPPARVGF